MWCSQLEHDHQAIGMGLSTIARHVLNFKRIVTALITRAGAGAASVALRLRASRVRGTGQVIISVSSPLWVYNCTGLPVALRISPNSHRGWSGRRTPRSNTPQRAPLPVTTAFGTSPAIAAASEAGAGPARGAWGRNGVRSPRQSTAVGPPATSELWVPPCLSPDGEVLSVGAPRTTHTAAMQATHQALEAVRQQKEAEAYAHVARATHAASTQGGSRGAGHHAPGGLSSDAWHGVTPTHSTRLASHGAPGFGHDSADPAPHQTPGMYAQHSAGDHSSCNTPAQQVPAPGHMHLERQVSCTSLASAATSNAATQGQGSYTEASHLSPYPQPSPIYPSGPSGMQAAAGRGLGSILPPPLNTPQAAGPYTDGYSMGLAGMGGLHGAAQAGSMRTVGSSSLTGTSLTFESSFSPQVPGSLAGGDMAAGASVWGHRNTSAYGGPNVTSGLGGGGMHAHSVTGSRSSARSYGSRGSHAVSQAGGRHGRHSAALMWTPSMLPALCGDVPAPRAPVQFRIVPQGGSLAVAGGGEEEGLGGRGGSGSTQWWSQAVSLGDSGSPLVVALPCPTPKEDAASGSVRELSAGAYFACVRLVRVRGARGCWALHILPRFVLHNALNLPLQLQQQGAGRVRTMAEVGRGAFHLVL